MLIHREALELAKLAATEDDGKYALTCLMVEADGHVVVCDGHQLIRVNAKVDEPSLFDSLIPIEEREQTESLLLPAEAAESFNAALKKRKKKKGEATPSVVISSDDLGAIRLASADGKVTRRFDVKPPEDPFPNITSLMRPHAEVKRVTLGVELMIDVLRILKNCGCDSITLSLAEGEGAPVKISAFSSPMGPVEGVVMPRRVDEAAKEEAA